MQNIAKPIGNLTKLSQTALAWVRENQEKN